MKKQQGITNFGVLIIVALICLIIAFFSGASQAEPVGALNPAVTEATIDSTICIPNWTMAIRPPAGYTNRIKASQLLPGTDLSLYEEDHFVPLSLGGAPRDRANLWPQPWAGRCNAKDKDRLELALKSSVCYGALTLKDAQAYILITNWRKSYRQFFGKDC